MKDKEMRENEETEVLNKLYQGAEMGVVGINTVLDKACKEEFRNVLETQKKEYDKISEEIVEILKKYGCEEKKLGSMTKMSSELMSQMKLKMDNSDSQIAKMIMEGNNKGIIEVTKIKNEYQGNDEEIKKLMSRFLDTEEHNLNEMKEYL